MPASIETLLADPRFIRWVLLEEDASHWEDWMAGDPDRPSQVEEARTVLRSLAIREGSLSEQEIEGRVSAILRSIHEAQPVRADAPAGRGRVRRMRWGWAAAAALLAGSVAAWWLSREAVLPSPGFTYVTIVTGDTGTRTVSLPDGSQVIVFPKSSLRYAAHPDTAVDVSLSGKAQFSVTLGPNRPFRVHTRDMVTTVLGTRFVVSDDEVTVLSGKVSVTRTAAAALPSVQVKPNLSLVYQPVTHDFVKKLVDTPVAVRAAVTPDFRYDNAAVTEVLEQLKATYDLDIIYDKDVLKNCRISADLSDESIYRKLDLICQALDAHYTVTDGVVHLDAKACE